MFEMKKDMIDTIYPPDECECAGYAGTINNWDQPSLPTLK